MTDPFNNHADLPSDDEAAKLLSRARQADREGRSSLAFHLYIAAFEELEASAGTSRRQEARDALNAAWDIALSLGDRRLAETALEKLMPYLGPEEAANDAKKLANLAMSDLNALGIDPSNLSQMPDLSALMSSLPPEVAEMIDSDELNNLLTGGTGFNVKVDDEGPLDQGAARSEHPAGPDQASQSEVGPVGSGAQTPEVPKLHGAAAPGMVPGNAFAGGNDFAAAARQFLSGMMGGGMSNLPFGNVNAQPAQPKLPPLRFSDVPGFSDLKQVLRSYGIGINPNSELGHQAEDDLHYHGITGQVALPAIVIRVPEGTDLTRLIAAAAGEMGVPFGQISVSPTGAPARRHQPQEVSIRVRGDIAPTRPGEMPADCLLFLDNADRWPSGLASRMRRIGDFVSSIAAQPGSAVILTVTGDAMPPRDLYNRLGPEVQVVAALPPSVTERYAAWTQIAAAHPSAGDIDVALLAMVSDGMMPDTFEDAVHDAATDAWRLGMKEHERHQVSTIDVLGRLADYAPDEAARERILSVVETQWSTALDHLSSDDLALLGMHPVEEQPPAMPQEDVDGATQGKAGPQSNEPHA